MTSETEEAVARVESDLAATCPPGSRFACAVVGKKDLRTILSAFSASQAEVERLARERDEAVGDRNAHAEHVRRVAAEANEGFDALEVIDRAWDAVGTRENRKHLSLDEQVTIVVRDQEATEARATRAEAEVERLRGALEEARDGLSIAAGWARSKPDSDRARSKIKRGLDAIRAALNPDKAARQALETTDDQ